LAVTLESARGHFLLHGIFNAYWEPLAFEVPAQPTPEQQWRRCIDTALASPDDILPVEEAAIFSGTRYVAQPRSVVLFALGLDIADHR
jgi:glycogen operon protein